MKAPCVLHFRIATSGGQRKDLCHPFPVSRHASAAMVGNSDRILAHNGHFEGWYPVLEKLAKKRGEKLTGPWSDTRAAAWIAKEIGDEYLTKLGQKGQKIVTLDLKGELLTFGSGWTTIDGNEYSNTVWRPGSYRGFYGRDWEDWDTSSRSYSLPTNVRPFVRNTTFRTLYNATFTFSEELHDARKEYRDQKSQELLSAITSNEIKRQSSDTSLVRVPGNDSLMRERVYASRASELPEGCERLVTL